ncbi:MAG: hypothetical protein NW207_07430 [Cytophagales bacterium]|nr:hypothetical protein [Cytophagales bacterium]
MKWTAQIFIASALLICMPVFSQLIQVEYSGAIGPTDWTRGWTNYKPVETDYPPANTLIPNMISTNTYLSKRNVYLLKGFVYVANNATLYIEAGAIIRADRDSKAVLVITKGAKIRAIGTETEPIIFTSNQNKGERSPGDWGGIMILGNSGINNPKGSAVAEGIQNPDLGAYGGSDPEDNSGIMRYVRIEFPGYKIINNEKELNGLTMFGVGRRTKIEYVQVSFSKDDSYEWFGGTVNCNNLISYKCTDDDFDMTAGFSGILQFGVALRNPGLKDISGSSGIEADTYGKETEFDYNDKVLTRSVISNFTIISPDPGKDAFAQGFTQNKYAVSIKNNGQISVYNTLIMGFQNGFYIGGAQSEGYIETNQIKLKNNLLYGAVSPMIADVKSNIDLNTWYVTPEYKNTYIRNYDNSILTDPFNHIYPNFSPIAGSAVLKSSSFDELKKYLEGILFYDKPDYIGAFGNVDWTAKWSNFDPAKTQYPDKTVVTVQGKITADTKWTASNTYLLKGIVVVENNAILTIEPGTVVKGDAATKGVLLINNKSKIIAEGTETSPIIFTSSKSTADRKPGDWGGIVILGAGRTNNRDNMTSFKNYGPLSNYTFGGSRFWEESGSLKYVRVEHAGGLIQGSPQKMAAIMFGGVNKINMDYVQVSCSEANGFGFVGGSANGKHLIAFSNTDDDFDVEEGYGGILQYGVVLRNPITADIKKSNSLESFATEVENAQFLPTNAFFTNFSFIGPLKTRAAQYNLNLNSCIHLNKNSSISVSNSIILGYPKGVIFEGDKVDFNILSQQLSFKNNIVAGCFSPILKVGTTGMFDGLKDPKPWFTGPAGKNKILLEAAEVKLTDPFNIASPNFLPAPGSPCLNTVFMGY